MSMLAMLILPLGFMVFYYWRREMWIGIVCCISWLAAGLVFQSQSAGMSPVDFADHWMVLFWICMMMMLGFGFVIFRWRPGEIMWKEGEDEDTGEPVMVMYRKGTRTYKTRELTDLEMEEREQRIKETQTRSEPRRSKPSSFGETGKI